MRTIDFNLDYIQFILVHSNTIVSLQRQISTNEIMENCITRSWKKNRRNASPDGKTDIEQERKDEYNNSIVNEDVRKTAEDEVLFYDTRTCSPSDEMYDDHIFSESSSPKRPPSNPIRNIEEIDDDDTEISLEGGTVHAPTTAVVGETDGDNLFGQQVASIMRQIGSEADKSLARIQILQILHGIQFPSNLA
ncbi:unnamed protein product [Lepeophtheirus salmonis]|uniref:(salmon louse) hypothetical protein n=1 Tax=Lepeophtheirus salmonis TaxID=72036 RepID=A0A7R8H819_LEPSM|nr:unnamed protein product [Lepeophtheirus salmonis]CAF2931391.1 unnamed protein product [Lepeophtheirus salmonis]